MAGLRAQFNWINEEKKKAGTERVLKDEERSTSNRARYVTLVTDIDRVASDACDCFKKGYQVLRHGNNVVALSRPLIDLKLKHSAQNGLPDDKCKPIVHADISVHYYINLYFYEIPIDCYR